MEQCIWQRPVKKLKINFDHANGYLEISGRSIHENGSDAYRPLIDALEIYAANALPITNVSIHFKYFSASSYKCMLNVFRKLADIKKKGKGVVINWNYEDAFLLELGRDYQAIINLPFQMIEVPENQMHLLS